VNDKYLDVVGRVVLDAEKLRAEFFAGAGPALVAAAEAMAASLQNGGKLMLFGNGGSAADAQHIAAEFVNKLDGPRAPLAALALTTDTSALTAIANDSSYDDVFARQLAALGRRGDVAVGITTSGNSASVLAALRRAGEMGLTTVGLLGRDGGKAEKLCRHALVVRHASTQRVQEVHSMIGHILVELVELRLFGGGERA